jgi:hypothetical protein
MLRQKSLGLETIAGRPIMLTGLRSGEQFRIIAHAMIDKDMAFYTVTPSETFLAHG